MSDRMFQAPAAIMGARTLADGTVKLDVAVQEVDPAEMALLFAFSRQVGWLLFKLGEQRIDESQVPAIELDTVMGETKSPGQRLHNVLYRYWENNTSQKQPFEVFYRAQMERIITRFREEMN